MEKQTQDLLTNFLNDLDCNPNHLYYRYIDNDILKNISFVLERVPVPSNTNYTTTK
jgi:hypothetical protein